MHGRTTNRDIHCFYCERQARWDQSAAILSCSPPHVCFPTRKRQDCPDTLLSETVTTVSLSAPSTVACSEQLAHSRKTEPPTTSTCFQLTTLALTPTDSHRHCQRCGVSKKKTPPPTELQISATVTTLVECHNWCELFYFAFVSLHHSWKPRHSAMVAPHKSYSLELI